MNKTLTDAWDKAGRTGEAIDIGNIVVCDACRADFTGSGVIKGGFLFGSYAICPFCAPDWEQSAKRWNEHDFIRARAEPGESFRAFVLRCRAGNNTVSIKPLRL